MLKTILKKFSTQNFLPPVKVAITGAAGNIGYALLYRIASGQMLGLNQPVILNLIDIPECIGIMKGVAMELFDCAFPTLIDVKCTADLKEGFKDIDYALLVGAKPRGPGMERGDLLKDNGKIFITTGKALNDFAKRTCRTIVVGNPANTNCLITQYYAKNIPKENFTAMTRLDHNRALYQLCNKTNASISQVKRLAIWGNHSATQVPDITHTQINGKLALELVSKDWINKTFIPSVQQRGAEIIKARKLSSAASAASACIDHIHDWVFGTEGWVSMAIPTQKNPYNIPNDLIFSFPVQCQSGKYSIIQNLSISSDIRSKLDKTTKELIEERNAIESLLK